VLDGMAVVDLAEHAVAGPVLPLCPRRRRTRRGKTRRSAGLVAGRKRVSRY
jgi:hypothetical protein